MWLQPARKTLRAAGLMLCAAAALATSVAAADDGDARIFKRIQKDAANLAARPYHPQAPSLPPFLADLNYDQYRDVRFRPDQSLWRSEKLPFEAQFFSRGFYYKDQVKVNVVDGDHVEPYKFKPSLFDFGRLPVPASVPSDLGFAGFRLHYHLNNDDYRDEVIAFLGASYFRAVGRGDVYGLSARGLALNTGTAQSEEFPVFREFWLEKPAPEATSMTLYALLDSPSVAGAYRFVLKPGAPTEIDVTAHLWFRSAVEKLGVAPLTSMYYRGTTTPRIVDDFRPEIHDSDGLLIAAGNGERLWRPLNNPQQTALSIFHVDHPRGFGLLQRQRAFDRYQDLEADYQRRPSAWIEPVGDWGAGAVELLELPSTLETNDNIVAYWVPAEPVTAGSMRTFEYRLSFGDDPEAGQLGGRTIDTLTGWGGDKKPNDRKFVIDFAGPSLAKLPADAVLTADVTASTGTPGKPVVQRNQHTGGYRVFFDFTPGPEPVAELRCTLRSGTDYIAETWTYQWRRETP